MANFDWSSLSQQVNAAYFTFGLSVAQSLFDGSRFARISEAKKTRTVEEERALLLGLGVIYEVDLNALQLSKTQQDVMAQERVVKSREVVVKQISSRYREGLEAGADLAREVADLHYAMLLLDVSRTEHYIANFELEAAAVMQEETPKTDARGPELPEEQIVAPGDKKNPVKEAEGRADEPDVLEENDE
jgi:outer membrane protein TolC